MHIAVDRQAEDQLQDADQAAQPGVEPAHPEPSDMLGICSEDDIRAALEAMGSGLELVTYTRTDDEKQLAYDIEFNFGDYDDFRDLGDICPEEGTDSEAEGQFNFSYEEQPDGSWKFERDFGSVEATENEYSEEEDLPEPVDLARIADRLQGLALRLKGMDTTETPSGDSSPARLAESLSDLTAGMEALALDAEDDVVRLVVHFPGPVLESNGTSSDTNTVTWEYTLSAISEAPRIATARVGP